MATTVQCVGCHRYTREPRAQFKRGIFVCWNCCNYRCRFMLEIVLESSVVRKYYATAGGAHRVENMVHKTGVMGYDVISTVVYPLVDLPQQPVV